MAPAIGRLDDPDHYLDLARSLGDGSGFAIRGRPTAYRPPLYPILLAPIVGLMPERRLPWGVAGLHLVLGAATVALVHATARRWGLGRARAAAAALLVGLDPVLLVQARAVMTETLAAALVAATLLGLTFRGFRGAALGGLGFGLATLCRPGLLPGAGLVALAALAVGTGGEKGRIRMASTLILATALTLAPWAWRNARALGRPIWTTTHGGYTLALANNPAYYADVLDGPPGAVWSGPNQARWFAWVDRSIAGLPEPEADRTLRGSALATIRADPRRFGRASLARLGRFWGLAPSGSVYPGPLRLATAAWTVPFWIAAALGLARPGLRTWPGVAAPLMVGALTMVHLAYWTDLRMRAPIIPALALIGAGAWMRRRPGIGADPRAPGG